MTAEPIWTKTTGVISAAELCFVFWVPWETAKILFTMSKLALVPILAESIFLEWPAQLCLVPHGVVGAGSSG